MAKYRQIHTTFWNDPLILDLTPEQKYFYLYLLTNPNVKQAGIYEISIRQITYHTGYNKETVEKLLELFVGLNKIVISKKTNEIAIVNFLKYNYSASPTVKKCIEKELEEVKNKDLIKYIYSIDSLSVEYIDNNKNKNKNKKKENNNNSKIQDFDNKISDFIKRVKIEDDYKEYHKEFIDYWLEAGDNNKPRFMYQKIFDIKKRLARWSKNNFSSNKNKLPDYYDQFLEKKLSGDKLTEYHNHLKLLGWKSVYNPNSGQTWSKPK